MKSLWNDLSSVNDSEIQCTFLDVESDALCISNLQPKHLEDSIIELRTSVLGRGCTVVIIYKILHRAGDNGFNVKTDTTNQLLESFSADMSGIVFLRHKHNNFNRRFTRDYVANDGVHVDYVKGIPRYYTSVRGSILLAKRHLSK